MNEHAIDEKRGKSAIGRLSVLVVVVIGLLLAMRFLPIQQWLRTFNEWVGQMGVLGFFIFIAVYAVGTVLMAPGSILTIGAGFAFGLWKGFVAVSAGATLGASLAFLVARFIARSKVCPRASERPRHIVPLPPSLEHDSESSSYEASGNRFIPENFTILSGQRLFITFAATNFGEPTRSLTNALSPRVQVIEFVGSLSATRQE